MPKSKCFNPFRKAGEKGHNGKNLRSLSRNLRIQFPDIPDNAKICSTCRLKAGKNDDDDNISDTSSTSDISVHTSREEQLEELLKGLKEKFLSLSTNDPLRLSILTIAPSSWSIRQIAREFGASRHMAKKAKELRNLKGVLASTTSKSGRKLSEATVANVVKFFNSDVYGRIMPGKKDAVSVKIDDKRTLVQKRLLLSGLKELHYKYKEEHPFHPISFSAFAKLRPKNCVFAGAAGTHSVCVCTIHENCKLMLDAINIEDLTKNLQHPLTNYKDCLQFIMCKKQTPSCHLNQCEKCPNIQILSELLINLLNKECIHNVLFSKWTSTDRSNLVTEKLPIEDFVKELCDRLNFLKPHSFIAKQQSLYLEYQKQNLRTGEVLVLYDFSENYAYVIQNASQAFHFNNDQCTVMPAVYYYRNEKVIKHKSIVFLSDCLKHDTASVYVVQSLLINEIKKNINVKKIIYFSDGAKQHFKNRFQIANLLKHKEDFQISAEWHFHATAHGKNAYDGIGAIFKREATRASLEAPPTQPLTNATSLFNWAKQHFTNIEILFYSEQMHKKAELHVKKRFTDARPIPKISSRHAFIVLPNGELFIKIYSYAERGEIIKIA